MVVLLCGCATAPTGAGPDTPPTLGHANPTNLDRKIAALSKQTQATDADNGKQATTWAQLGATLYRAERPNEALDALTKSIALAPNRAHVHFNRGLVLTALGRYPEAKNSYLSAAKLAPDDQNIPYNLGILYEIYLNQPKQALAAYQAYLTLGGPDTAQVEGWVATLTRSLPAK